MADTPKHSVSVAGIVVDDQERVLVIQRRDNGHWEPPGGVLELAETPEQGARREVLEESGVDVEVVALTGVYKNMSRGILALVFRCRLVAGSPDVSEEAASVRWMTASDVKQSMSPAYSIRVIDALNGGLHVRAHDGTNLFETV